MPRLSTQIPPGWLNLAVLPFPSANPLIPGLPAMVVTIPFGLIFLIQWFLKSAINILPKTSLVMPTGRLNWALTTFPSLCPVTPVPAPLGHCIG